MVAPVRAHLQHALMLAFHRRRRHSGLGFLTPARAYEQMARAA